MEIQGNHAVRWKVFSQHKVSSIFSSQICAFFAVVSISSCKCYAQVIANKPINASYALKRSFISVYQAIV